jgi:hypothetical protein
MTKKIRDIIDAAIAQQAAAFAECDRDLGLTHYVGYTPYLRNGTIVIDDPSPRGSRSSEPHYCWGKVTCHRDGSISILWDSHDDGPWPAVRIQNPTVEAVLYEINDVQLPDPY